MVPGKEVQAVQQPDDSQHGPSMEAQGYGNSPCPAPPHMSLLGPVFTQSELQYLENISFLVEDTTRAEQTQD